MDLLQLLRRMLGRAKLSAPYERIDNTDLRDVLARAIEVARQPAEAADVKLSSVCPAILRVAITTERQVKYHGYAMVGADGELVPGSFVITGMSPDGS